MFTLGVINSELLILGTFNDSRVNISTFSNRNFKGKPVRP